MKNEGTMTRPKEYNIPSSVVVLAQLGNHMGKKINLTSHLHLKKINSKWILDLHVKIEIIKF